MNLIMLFKVNDSMIIARYDVLCCVLCHAGEVVIADSVSGVIGYTDTSDLGLQLTIINL